MEAVYSEAIKNLTKPEVKPNDTSVRFDCVFSDTPVHSFVRWYVQMFGSGVVVSPEVGARVVNLNLRGATGPEIMQMAARVLGVNAARIGNTYYLGEVRKTDAAVYVCKVTRLKREQIDGIVKMLISASGASIALENGLTVVTDSPEVLGKVERTLGDLENVQQDCWVVQLMITEGNQTLSELVGIDSGTPDIGLSAVINSNFSGTGTTSTATEGAATASGSSLNFSATLDGAIYNSKARGAFSAVYAPMVIALDGETVKMHSGRTYRYAKTTTSQYGVSSSNGTESITDGLELSMLVRESGKADAILEMDLSLATVEGFQKDLPITAERTLTTKAQVQSGGFYVLGRLEYENITRSKTTGIMTYLKDDSRTDQRVYVFARVYRISGLKGDIGRLAGGPGGRTDAVEGGTPDRGPELE